MLHVQSRVMLAHTWSLRATRSVSSLLMASTMQPGDEPSLVEPIRPAEVTEPRWTDRPETVRVQSRRE